MTVAKRAVAALVAGALFLSLPRAAPGGAPANAVGGPGDEDWPAEAPLPATSADPRIIKALVETLRGVENLSVHLLPGGAILQGSLLTAADMTMVKRVAAGAPGILNLCRLDPEALEVAACHLRREMARLDMSGLAVGPAGEAVLVTGTPGSPQDTAQLKKICEALAIPLVDGTRPDGCDRRMVTFEVCFTEVNRQAFRELGVKWPSSLSLADPGGARFDRVDFSQSLQVAIDLMVQSGEGRILSRPLLVCRSGEPASFLAGGEIPIPKRNKDGDVTVLWKNYGIMLEIAPQVDPRGVILARISAEISMLDRANSVEGIPGILSRRVGTALSLAEGQTVVLSGLVNTEDAQQVQEVPVLSAIPVLGELFRSRGFQRKETELLIFLTPRFSPPDVSHPLAAATPTP
jgi:pilus assembly protein CpaC